MLRQTRAQGELVRVTAYSMTLSLPEVTSCDVFALAKWPCPYIPVDSSTADVTFVAPMNSRHLYRIKQLRMYADSVNHRHH